MPLFRTQILLPVSRRRLRAPNEGLPGNKGHQGQDVSGTTRRQLKGCRAHISTPPPTTIQPRPRPASTQPRISTPPGGTSHTTPTPASASTKPTPPKSPQAPKQEDFADQGSSVPPFSRIFLRKESAVFLSNTPCSLNASKASVSRTGIHR